MIAKDLFIDTNIFLSFYHYSRDDIEQLNKLLDLIQGGKIKLWLPEQVISEFRRNRENKIIDAMGKLKEQRIKFEFPVMSRSYEQYKQLEVLSSQYNELHKKLMDSLEQDAKSKALAADKLIDKLFVSANSIENSKDIVNLARLRYDIGNPPGKKGSLGDAINWESLLEKVPEDKRLYFIAADKDYYSQLDNNSFHPFLADEWQKKNGGKIIFYKQLSTYLKEHHPNIKLAADVEKDALIEKLSTSQSFSITHSIVHALSKYSDFNQTQLNDIITAAIFNDQVSYVLADDDVYEFINKVTAGQESNLDEGNLRELREAMHFADIVRFQMELDKRGGDD